MDVIINDVTESLPARSEALITQGNWLSNLLFCLRHPERSPRHPERSEGPPHTGSMPHNRRSLATLGMTGRANLLARYHQLDGQDWLIAEPIRWEATHNDAMIVAAGSELHLSDEQSRHWFTVVTQFLKDDGFEFYYHNPSTWMLRASDKPALNSPPARSLLHQSLMPVLDELDSTLYWQKLFTELQMLLNTHSNNPINGLWFSGGGSFIMPPDKHIMTDDEHLLTCFPQNAHKLDLTKSLNNNVILLINDKNKIDFNRLQTILTTQSVRWFWNNLAYATIKKKWWNWF